MSQFQLREMHDRPLDEQRDNEPHLEKPSSLELENLPRDLMGAADAEGKDEVKIAVTQVAVGRADHKELLAWIDDIRESEHHHGDQKETEQQEVEKRDGFLHDFQADTEIAAGEVDAPPVDATDSPNEKARVLGVDDDFDMMFPGTRRKKKGDEDDDDESDDSAATAPKTEEKKAKSKKA